MESKDRLVNSKTSVYNLGYHIIWCTKYRKPCLSAEIQLRLKQLINEKANYLKCNLVTIETMPDHIHIFIKTPPIYAPHFVVKQLKGYTSRILRNEYDELKRKLPTLWTRSYYMESVGHISENAIKNI